VSLDKREVIEKLIAQRMGIVHGIKPLYDEYVVEVFVKQ